MTASDLRCAFGVEAMLCIRYEITADKAQAEGFPNAARFFRAVAFSEKMHAQAFFHALRDEPGVCTVSAQMEFGIGSTADNLADCLDRETFQVDEMYATFIRTAKAQKEEEAERAFHYAQAAEKDHAEICRKVQQAIDKGKDVKLGPLQVCRVCGHTVEGDAPATCPICDSPKEKFVTFA